MLAVLLPPMDTNGLDGHTRSKHTCQQSPNFFWTSRLPTRWNMHYIGWVDCTLPVFHAPIFLVFLAAMTSDSITLSTGPHIIPKRIFKQQHFLRCRWIRYHCDWHSALPNPCTLQKMPLLQRRKSRMRRISDTQGHLFPAQPPKIKKV